MGVADAFNAVMVFTIRSVSGTLIFKPFIISSENSEGLPNFLYVFSVMNMCLGPSVSQPRAT